MATKKLFLSLFLWISIQSIVIVSSEEKITNVVCITTVDPTPVVIEVHHEWSPLGAQRYLQLVKGGFFTNSPLFRVVKNFLVQFGIAQDPATHSKWVSKGPIHDDPKIDLPFKKGFLSFAGSGPNSRTTELFIAYNKNNFGTELWETPLGVVVSGMEVLDKIYDGYGDVPPFGNGPSQHEMYLRGNEYLEEDFPDLDYWERCEIQGDSGVGDDDDSTNKNDDSDGAVASDDDVSSKKVVKNKKDDDAAGSNSDSDSDRDTSSSKKTTKKDSTSKQVSEDDDDDSTVSSKKGASSNIDDDDLSARRFKTSSETTIFGFIVVILFFSVSIGVLLSRKSSNNIKKL
eukprot:TRINITY_DN97_c3_g1_i10.p1 TRINITY_DN97_c3_g1~~TRINITY_DN97_c3_g1_i10.p1  ORF type:complete len:343 (+),score=86.60 TRINITY_DN97_c3_g1_i10:2916-3944(+)